MFESSVVESRKTKVGIQRLMTLPVSVGLHAVVILAFLIGTIWSVQSSCLDLTLTLIGLR